jgi:prepilin-type N-terminal cleavage/methylation domain-containing protein
MRRAGERGVTLLEMLIVLALLSLLAGISFPSVSAGIDSIRLRTAADSVASLLSLGMSAVERREQLVEIGLDLGARRLSLRSYPPGLSRELLLPDGVFIAAIHPEPPGEQPRVRELLLYPGAPFPGVIIELANRRGARRLVRIDPLAGVPAVEVPPS